MFLNISVLQSRHVLLTKKKNISANSPEQQILSLERQRREVILSLPLTFTDITLKTDIAVSIICLGQEITECVITVTYTVFMLQLLLPASPSRPMFFCGNLIPCSCKTTSMWTLSALHFFTARSVKALKIIFKLVPIVLLLSAKLGRVIFEKLFLRTNDDLL